MGDKGEEGFKKSQKMDDVIYGRPQMNAAAASTFIPPTKTR